MIPTKLIAVTGSDGYLGSSVMQALFRRRWDHAAVPGQLQDLPPRSLDCSAVIHCAGRLRGHSACRMWIDNVTATSALLYAIPPAAPIVLASSRAAAMTTSDQYGCCKRQAERLVASHSGPSSIVRLTVLAGPSPRGLGSSFLARMIKSAVPQASVVDLLDVREAAAALVALVGQRQERCLTVHATSGPIDVLELAELIAHTVSTATGKSVKLTRGFIAGNGRPNPANPESWQELLAQNGVSRIPLESTVRDTIAAQVVTESDHAVH